MGQENATKTVHFREIDLRTFALHPERLEAPIREKIMIHLEESYCVECAQIVHRIKTEHHHATAPVRRREHLETNHARYQRLLQMQQNNS